MRLKKGFVLRNVCGENALIGEGVNAINFGKLLTLNETAAFLWKEAAEGDFSPESLATALCKEYEVEADEARRDVDDILSQWQQEGFIEE